MTTFSLFQFIIRESILEVLLSIGVAFILFYIVVRRSTKTAGALVVVLVLMLSATLLWFQNIPRHIRTFGPADGPVIKTKDIIAFFKKAGDMERVPTVARDPNDVPNVITRTSEDHVKITLETKEVIGEMADGIEFNYWTFNDTVPGPMLRVREGDTVELAITNDPKSIHHHNIDLHAVTGPGGGAAMTNIAPGETKTITFKTLNPGLYVYHCAHPNVAVHMAHGMYGLILVEPKAGLPSVDKEFYVMQGEFYSTGKLGKSGLQIFDAQAMLAGQPQYIVFNGRVGGATGNMTVKTGERVRLYVGNGGVNLVSSFHVIGEIFDRVYPEAAIGPTSPILENVQTTMIPAGGAAIVEFTADVPGKYILVDHALSRLDRGAWGTIDVTGPDNPSVISGEIDASESGH